MRVQDAKFLSDINWTLHSLEDDMKYCPPVTFEEALELLSIVQMRLKVAISAYEKNVKDQSMKTFMSQLIAAVFFAACIFVPFFFGVCNHENTHDV